MHHWQTASYKFKIEIVFTFFNFVTSIYGSLHSNIISILCDSFLHFSGLECSFSLMKFSTKSILNIDWHFHVILPQIVQLIPAPSSITFIFLYLILHVLFPQNLDCYSLMTLIMHLMNLLHVVSCPVLISMCMILISSSLSSSELSINWLWLCTYYNLTRKTITWALTQNLNNEQPTWQ